MMICPHCGKETTKEITSSLPEATPYQHKILSALEWAEGGVVEYDNLLTLMCSGNESRRMSIPSLKVHIHTINKLLVEKNIPAAILNVRLRGYMLVKNKTQPIVAGSSKEADNG